MFLPTSRQLLSPCIAPAVALSDVVRGHRTVPSRTGRNKGIYKERSKDDNERSDALVLFVRFLFLVVMPGSPSSFLLLVS